MFISFLLGAIAAFSFTAAVFFLRFWRDTRDFFFVPFAVFFLVEGGSRVALLFFQHPSEGSFWIYFLRFCALLLILFGILQKNYGRGK
jgi:uncharacterized membrane protein HdeD (DUF308 family)